MGAMTCQESLAAWQKWVSHGEPYSVAACEVSDPRVRFKQAEGRVLQVSTGHPESMLRDVKLDELAAAAKAALEAGLNEKAKSYAEQALALARRDWCIDSRTPPDKRGAHASGGLGGGGGDASDRAAQDFCSTTPGSYSLPQTRGDAIATSNLVLGRLALLHGDVSQAGKFLVASGQIKAGRQTAQFGPNMVLALELLKMGIRGGTPLPG